jgi:D-alanyl-D-alanine carboxypeptidase
MPEQSEPLKLTPPQKRSSRKLILLLVLFGWLVMMGIGAAFIIALQPAGSDSTLEETESKLDERPLVVEVVRPKREILNPFTEVTIRANKEIKLEPHNRVELEHIGESEGRQYYVARIINLAIDTTPVTLKISDEVGNSFEELLTITRKSMSFPVGFKDISSWEGSEYVLDADTYTGPINKDVRLLEDYEPEELIDLNEELGLYTLNNAHLRADAARALKKMLDAMAKDIGKYVTIASGYRSYNTQITTYAFWVQQVGEKRADEISARPGHSEHQLGTTVDFVSDETNWDVDESFAGTAAGKWLAQHSEEYGFKQFLTKDQDHYAPEPWQYRYIGEGRIKVA